MSRPKKKRNRRTRTAGVCIDDWKLPVFDRLLSEAGFKFNRFPGPVAGSILLKVIYDPSEIDRLGRVIRKCQEEAAARKETLKNQPERN